MNYDKSRWGDLNVKKYITIMIHCLFEEEADLYTFKVDQ